MDIRSALLDALTVNRMFALLCGTWVQFQIAQDRDPGAGLDLSELNLADPSEVFKRKL